MRLKIVAKRSILETLTNHGRGLIIKEQKYCPLGNFDYFLETRISRNFPRRLFLEVEPLEIVGWKLLAGNCWVLVLLQGIKLLFQHLF